MNIVQDPSKEVRDLLGENSEHFRHRLHHSILPFIRGTRGGRGRRGRLHSNRGSKRFPLRHSARRGGGQGNGSERKTVATKTGLEAPGPERLLT
mmetsp:Transcript_743/g.541  ORF Transcript_743/g.541 Transcript_743/m.541 type:complete len:94 (+) Transcript_743:48-329(+)